MITLFGCIFVAIGVWLVFSALLDFPNNNDRF